MLFNSFDFAIFLPIVFAIYWLIGSRNLKLQNLFVVAASYLFYGWWDWRFLSLIIFSTIVDYSVGRGLAVEQNQTKRKGLLWTSLATNLGFLAVFKYYNFFLENFSSAFSFAGGEIAASSLDIVLPVGISFYTFQTLSYSIDVYKGKLQPTKDYIAFSAFVSFFPQLVAGPIERASNLLPQLLSKRVFDYSKAVDGMRQMLWGLFKKIVIADNCAEYTNLIFNNSADLSGSTLLLGALFFTFQIYCDFSGYSDIAIGASRLFGINLTQNFAFPFFSRDIAEFWRRWHISLSTWFRDYLYIPLGGSRGNTWTKVRNVFILFAVSGFWHGANWTFIVWGLLNALYFLPLLLMKKNRDNRDVVAAGKILPSISETLKMFTTFMLTALALAVFRAENLTHAYSYIINIFSSTLFTIPILPVAFPKGLILGITVFMMLEWYGRERQYAFSAIVEKLTKPVRVLVYLVLLFMIYYFAGEQQQFIYFQF
ncbi:MAG: hypothetical protein K9J12_13885 [Melioribacteraceae bacterium]|nr:hypothetical protein [Melioribacteraceae bacterium]MCF8263145.1 hypothetical protein [Melioribacteraceae bacterium]MCF8430375.1 hypothetical protein [Melioribacteraceae bacterium]